jgi:hypothetical protein
MGGVKPLACLVAGLSLASAASAQIEQSLVKQWGERFYLYRDAKGCALYIDYPDGRMIRLANRPSENMVYVNVVGPAWTELRPDLGKSASFTLFFKRGSMRFGQVALGQVIEDADGRFGYGGSNLGPDILVDIAHEGIMEIEPHVDEKPRPVLSFDLTGVAPAALALSVC